MCNQSLRNDNAHQPSPRKRRHLEAIDCKIREPKLPGPVGFWNLGFELDHCLGNPILIYPNNWKLELENLQNLKMDFGSVRLQLKLSIQFVPDQVLV
uniref:Uncharacterized protein n=1 Tax=Salix viminalis TaxID=40686 RepID=A0A6N2JXY9_SALVM